MARYDEDSGFSSPWFYGSSFNPHNDGYTAPGSAGDVASETYGPQVGNPIVTIVGQSSQVAQDRLKVVTGDTSAQSCDQPYGPDHGDDFTGVRLDYPEPGAQFQPGSGRAGHVRHPDAGR